MLPNKNRDHGFDEDYAEHHGNPYAGMNLGDLLRMKLDRNKRREQEVADKLFVMRGGMVASGVPRYQAQALCEAIKFCLITGYFAEQCGLTAQADLEEFVAFAVAKSPQVVAAGVRQYPE